MILSRNWKAGTGLIKKNEVMTKLKLLFLKIRTDGKRAAILTLATTTKMGKYIPSRQWFAEY